jgi:hypothetical protein
VREPNSTGVVMGEEAPRTRLEQILRQRHLTVEQFRKDYAKVSRGGLSESQAFRWVAGKISTLPYRHAQAALEQMFGEPVARLFGPPYGTGVVRSDRPLDLAVPLGRGQARSDWKDN